MYTGTCNSDDAACSSACVPNVPGFAIRLQCSSNEPLQSPPKIREFDVMKSTKSLRKVRWPEDRANNDLESDLKRQFPSGNIVSIVRPCFFRSDSNWWPMLPESGLEIGGLKHSLASVGTFSMVESCSCHVTCLIWC